MVIRCKRCWQHLRFFLMNLFVMAVSLIQQVAQISSQNEMLPIVASLGNWKQVQVKTRHRQDPFLNRQIHFTTRFVFSLYTLLWYSAFIASVKCEVVKLSFSWILVKLNSVHTLQGWEFVWQTPLNILSLLFWLS